MRKRWPALTATTILMVLAIPTASVGAQSMTSANQPGAISNPGVKVGIPPGTSESYEVELAFALICPARQPQATSVSFTDANGEITERLSKPCQGEWANNPTVPSDVLTEWSVMAYPGFAPILSGEAGSPPYVLFSPPPDASGPHPFLYQVEGPSGVIAQAPITAETTPEQNVAEGSPAYQEDCVAKGDVKRTASGSGYCIVAAGTTYVAGWPTPTPASAPESPTILCDSTKGTARVARAKPTRCNTLGPHQALAEAANLTDLHWTGWGAPEATGTGLELGQHLPLAHIKATVRAYRLQECGGAGRYTRLKIHDRFGTSVVSFPSCP
jgi:hypothetical protein